MIRAARQSDAAEIMSIRHSVLENAITPERLDELGISVESIAGMLETTHAAYCAEVEGSVVGFSMGDRASGSVFALFVRPEHEGRGIGAGLLDATVAALRRAGHRRLTLTTEPGTRAQSFYLRQGWRQTGTVAGGEVQLVLDQRK